MDIHPVNRPVDHLLHFTLFNTDKILGQIEMISKQPYPTAIAVGEVDADLSRLHRLSERLTVTRDREVIEAVRHDYRSVNASLLKNLDFMVENYTYNPGDAVKLRQTFFDLRAEEKSLLALASIPDFTENQAIAFLETNISPKIGEMYSITTAITNGSRSNLPSSSILPTIFATALIFSPAYSFLP